MTEDAPKKSSRNLNLSTDIKYSDDVIRLMAACAVQDVEGVYSMSGSIFGKAAKKLGKKDIIDGVDCKIKDGRVEVSVYLIVQYGYRIPDVALAVQRAAKKAIEDATGFEVVGVDVSIQGVDPGKKDIDDL